MIAENALKVYWIKIRFHALRIIQFGVGGIARRLLRKLSTALLAVFLFPVAAILFCLNYKRIIVFTDRIGHLASDLDVFVKASKLGLIKQRHWIIVAPKHRIANAHLLAYWDKYFMIIQSDVDCFLWNCLTIWPFMRFNISHFTNNDNGPQFAYTVYQQWGDRAPIHQLTEADEQWGTSILQQLGLPAGAWFVCVHAREAGFSPIDESFHCHRNSDIDNMIPAIKEITKRGGWVVRLGDPTMKQLPPLAHTIDYAHHPLRGARLDIILCAKAKFILGNTSGIFLAGSIFGTPSALANMIPIPTLGFYYRDISMPKLLWDKTKQQYLTFADIMNSPIATYRYAAMYQQANLRVEENTADDILQLTIEMFQQLNDDFYESEENRVLQQRYLSLLKPEHYSYGAVSAISATFLRRHLELLFT